MHSSGGWACAGKIKLSADRSAAILTAYVAIFKIHSEVKDSGLKQKLTQATNLATQSIGKIAAIVNSDFLLQLESNISEAAGPRFHQAVLSLEGHFTTIMDMTHIWYAAFKYLDTTISMDLENDMTASVVSMMKNRGAAMILCESAGLDMTGGLKAAAHGEVEQVITMAKEFLSGAEVYRKGSKTNAAFGTFVKVGNALQKVSRNSPYTALGDAKVTGASCQTSAPHGGASTHVWMDVLSINAF
jgi:hypothetical protein